MACDLLCYSKELDSLEMERRRGREVLTSFSDPSVKRTPPRSRETGGGRGGGGGSEPETKQITARVPPPPLPLSPCDCGVKMKLLGRR